MQRLLPRAVQVHQTVARSFIHSCSSRLVGNPSRHNPLKLRLLVSCLSRKQQNNDDTARRSVITRPQVTELRCRYTTATCLVSIRCCCCCGCRDRHSTLVIGLLGWLVGSTYIYYLYFESARQFQSSPAGHHSRPPPQPARPLKTEETHSNENSCDHGRHFQLSHSFIQFGGGGSTIFNQSIYPSIHPANRDVVKYVTFWSVRIGENSINHITWVQNVGILIGINFTRNVLGWVEGK